MCRLLSSYDLLRRFRRNRVVIAVNDERIKAFRELSVESDAW